MNSSRTTLRNFYKQQRAALTDSERAQAISAITQHLLDYPPLTQAKQVAAFMATASEVDLHLWMSSHWRRGGAIALPRVTPPGGMTFHRFTEDTPLEKNQYNIDEPPVVAAIVDPAEFDVVLVPLVAFDDHGHRLGMGGGYYDRYLAKLPSHTWLIGVAFSQQHARENLPQEPWDIPLHAVVTENGVLEWRSPATQVP